MIASQANASEDKLTRSLHLIALYFAQDTCSSLLCTFNWRLVNYAVNSINWEQTELNCIKYWGLKEVFYKQHSNKITYKAGNPSYVVTLIIQTELPHSFVDQFNFQCCHDLTPTDLILMCLLSSCCCGCQTLEQGLFIFGVFDILIRYTTHLSLTSTQLPHST